jgi:catechol 2,3-dioxygenase
MNDTPKRSPARPPLEPEFGIAPPGYRLPGGARVGPVRLQIRDLARSETFYTSVLGLVRHHRDDGTIALGAPGGGTLVELVEQPGIHPVKPLSRLGLYHFALLLPDRSALAQFARHLRDLGIRAGMADHLVSEAFYLSDPDGLGIEVYADRPRSQWRAAGNQLIMTTDPLDHHDLLAHAGATRFGGLPSETVMGHVHLHVRDLEVAAHFYHAALGFAKTVWNYPGALFLAAGGYHHHVGTNTWAAGAPTPGPEDARLLRWTLILPHEADVGEAARCVASAGYHVDDRGVGGFLANDPWGTALKVTARSSRNAEDSNVRRPS